MSWAVLAMLVLGDVADDGTYSSPIASPGRRFFTMLGTLVQGRVSLDGGLDGTVLMTLFRIGSGRSFYRRQP